MKVVFKSQKPPALKLGNTFACSVVKYYKDCTWY